MPLRGPMTRQGSHEKRFGQAPEVAQGDVPQTATEGTEIAKSNPVGDSKDMAHASGMDMSMGNEHGGLQKSTGYHTASQQSSTVTNCYNSWNVSKVL